ncbi:MAG: polymer-forming cytoskeletal protein [bacterium]|nr:polymer-forming cytoskeletal protein [bacterium]
MVFGSGKKSDKKGKDKDYATYEHVEPRPRATAVEEQASASYIGKTMRIEGGLVSDEDLTVEGQVKGTIDVTKTLTVGRHGDVSADINAKVVKIIGTARGTITAAEKVAILSEGRYTGNIRSEKLVVADGAILFGDINKEEKTAVPPAQAETTTTGAEIETKAETKTETKTAEPEETEETEKMEEATVTDVTTDVTEDTEKPEEPRVEEKKPEPATHSFYKSRKRK